VIRRHHLDGAIRAHFILNDPLRASLPARSCTRARLQTAGDLASPLELILLSGFAIC
jgi:hypothetical protein